MPTKIETHREYAKSAEIRLNSDECCDARCIACGCSGNQSCGHEPLGIPEHHCELRINDVDADDGRCWCCFIAGVELKEGDWNEPPEVAR